MSRSIKILIECIFSMTQQDNEVTIVSLVLIIRDKFTKEGMQIVASFVIEQKFSVIIVISMSLLSDMFMQKNHDVVVRLSLYIVHIYPFKPEMFMSKLMR